VTGRMVEVWTADEAVAVVRSGKETELTVASGTKWTQQQFAQLAAAIKTNSVLMTLNLSGVFPCCLWTDFPSVQGAALVPTVPRRWRMRSRSTRH